jgi:hypothetical protein
MLDNRKKNLVLFLLMLFALSFSQQRDTLLTVPLHQQVCIYDNKLCIQYDSLLHDSRCPLGVFCKNKSAGQVIIRLKINNDTITLSGYGGAINNKTTKNGYTMQVIAIYPYPGCNPPDSVSARDPLCSLLSSSVAIAVSKPNTGAIGKNGCSVKPSPLQNRNKTMDALGRVIQNKTKFQKRSKLFLFKSIKYR